MMVKKTRIDGNSARKKSKEIDDALVVSLPSNNPLKKNFNTLNSGCPSSPGKVTRRNIRMKYAKMLRRKVTFFFPNSERYLFSGFSKVFRLKIMYGFQAHIQAFDVMCQRTG